MFQGVPLHVRAREVGGGRQGGGDGGMRETAVCFRVFHYMYGPERWEEGGREGVMEG